MNLSFLPGELNLKKTKEGSYLITIQGKGILNTTSEKKALAEFNRIRKEMESRFPAHDLSREEKTQLLMKYIGESQGIPKESKKQGRKYTPGSTNTFG
jgi:hypothetical protein